MNIIKVIGILSEVTTLLLLPPFLVGVNSYRKEFSPSGSTLIGKNLLLEEQILSCKSRPYFNELPYPEKQTGINVSYKKLLSETRQGPLLEQGNILGLTWYNGKLDRQ